MKKLFYKKLGICSAITIIIMLLIVDAWMYILARTSFFRTGSNIVGQMEAILTEKERDINLMKELLEEETMDKARTFSWILSEQPQLLTNSSKLMKLCESMGLDELHIIDEKGIITSSTIRAYVGFDMAIGKQSAEFLKILEDASFELAQEAQENTADGKLMQYSGVARKDAKGFVQVGQRPLRLEEMFDDSSYEEIFRQIASEDELLYYYALDKSSGSILYHSDADLLGRDYQSVGYSMKTGQGRIRINGSTFYYMQREYGDMILGAITPLSGFFSETVFPTILISVNVIVVVTVLLFATRRLLEKFILNGLINVVSTIEQIGEGDYSVRLEEYSSPEFRQLSDGINSMLDKMNRGMKRNAELIAAEKEEAENNRQLILAIRDICDSLNVSATETMNNANSTWQGAEEQKRTVAGLEKNHASAGRRA